VGGYASGRVAGDRVLHELSPSTLPAGRDLLEEFSGCVRPVDFEAEVGRREGASVVQC